jgi:hypothetical protein
MLLDVAASHARDPWRSVSSRFLLALVLRGTRKTHSFPVRFGLLTLHEREEKSGGELVMGAVILYSIAQRGELTLRSFLG